MTKLSRIAYKDGVWLDLRGKRPEIVFQPPNKLDYFYQTMDGRILRLFSRACGGKESLGEILDFNGTRLAKIPPYVHPKFDKPPNSYESQVAWVQSEKGNEIEFVIYCSNPRDFRVRFNLTTLVFSSPEFHIR